MPSIFKRHGRASQKNIAFFTLLPVLLSALLTGQGLAQATLEQGYDAFERSDVADAVAIWRELAQQGNTTAQLNLGQLYRMGRGVEQNDREAVKWYGLAAKSGSETARYNLILMHSEGRATREDLNVAGVLPAEPPAELAADEQAETPAETARPGAEASAGGGSKAQLAAVAVDPSPDDGAATVTEVMEPVNNSAASPTPARQPGNSETGWFEQLPKPLYVLQLVSSPRKQELEQYRADKLEGVADNPLIVAATHKGRKQYLLLLGPYQTRRSAQDVIATLPSAVQQSKPWARPVASVQKIALNNQTPSPNAQNWFSRLPQQQYVLQLVSSRYKKSLRNYAAKHLASIGMPADVVTTTLDGRDNYLLLLGPFPTRQQARDTIAQLPADVQSNQPYPRPVISVQRIAK